MRRQCCPESILCFKPVQLKTSTYLSLKCCQCLTSISCDPRPREPSGNRGSSQDSLISLFEQNEQRIESNTKSSSLGDNVRSNKFRFFVPVGCTWSIGRVCRRSDTLSQPESGPGDEAKNSSEGDKLPRDHFNVHEMLTIRLPNITLHYRKTLHCGYKKTQQASL